MTTITFKLSPMELKLGQLPLSEVLEAPKNSNIDLLPSIISRNKDFLSVGCPIRFQASDSLFLALLPIFSIMIYNSYTTNIKEKRFLCL